VYVCFGSSWEVDGELGVEDVKTGLGTTAGDEGGEEPEHSVAVWVRL
jgi:hypothetical protein